MPALPQFPLARFVVADTSMQPALQPGERVLVWRWTRLRAGDIVVLRDPDRPHQYLVKRLGNRAKNGAYEVHGDNPNVSRDSRHFGAVPRTLLVGRVIYTYARR